jgi:hypothetical protein
MRPEAQEQLAYNGRQYLLPKLQRKYSNMFENEWTRRALNFGQKAFDATKTFSTEGLNVGKDLANEAVIFSQAVSASMKIIRPSKTAEKGRWDRRSGIWHSSKALPDCCEEIDTCLTQHASPHRTNLEVRPAEWEIIYSVAWIEQIPKFEDEEHSVQLKLTLRGSTQGTAVKYYWTVDDFPKGKIADRVLREVNAKLESLLEPLG